MFRQRLDRDTQQWAMKCSAAEVDGTWINVQKDPVTDHGKKSKAGRVTLFKDAATGEYTSGVENGQPSALVTVFENGKLLNELTFEQVRANSNA